MITPSHVDAAGVLPDQAVEVRDAACYRQSQSVNGVRKRGTERRGKTGKKKKSRNTPPVVKRKEKLCKTVKGPALRLISRSLFFVLGTSGDALHG